MSAVLPLERGGQTAWLKAAGLLALTWAAIALLFLPTTRSIVAIWERSETYAHGYVILPIVLWLMWRERGRIMAVETRPDARALIAVVLLLVVWLTAWAGGVLVAEQYALVGLWIAAAWALFGPAFLKAAAFPLGYLLLMVPNGEFLMQPLMDFTADFTVAAVRLIGIPVYREGTYFSLPSGDWSVVETCSGIRYILASLTLGLLYAYLTYRSLWKRLAFAVASLIVPVLANGMRATLIVLIAHYSDMKLALGVDHFIYGWVWFGIVMLLLFWVGLIWREDHLPAAEAPPPTTPRTPLAMAAGLVALTALGPLWQQWLARPAATPTLAAPLPAAGWQPTAAAFNDWQPRWLGMDAKLLQHYRRDAEHVQLFVAYYAQQRQDHELINSQNLFVEQEHERWQNVGERTRVLELGGASYRIREAKLRTARGERILAWQWNRVRGRNDLHPLQIKLELALRKVLGGRDDGAAYVIAAPYNDQPQEAERVLAAFLADYGPRLAAITDRP
ncbi:MAG: exosortase A [Thiobacillaceae bacterium]|nr:exosortase A [Thiobacillaceae bacterium]